jgi:pimeloyl-ACP methyl ester carboxylesterase
MCPFTGLRELLSGGFGQWRQPDFPSMASREEVFADAGYTVLAPSRPGYGRTPVTGGSGFRAGLRNFTDIAGYRETAAGAAQAALVIASPTDGAVPFAHARTLADALPSARLIASQAPGHFTWFSDDYPAIAAPARAPLHVCPYLA